MMKSKLLVNYSRGWKFPLQSLVTLQQIETMRMN